MSDYEWLRLLQLQTLIASVAVLILLPLRALLLRLGQPTLAYASWLLLPLALAAGLLPHPQTELPVFTLTVPLLVEAAAAPVAAPEAPISMQRLWLLAWGAGAMLTLVALAWQQLRFQRSLGPLRPAGTARVYQAGCNTTGPLVIGLLRPRIVVPADFAQRYSPQEQTLILAHERVHLARGDLFANTLASALQTVFWFNPLVHFAASRFRFDQELACDTAVLQQHPSQRQSYAQTILKTQMTATRLPVGCHWQSHHPLKDRIMQLTRPAPSPIRRRSLKVLLTALAFGSCYAAWAVGHTEAAVSAPPAIPPVPAVTAPAPPPVPRDVPPSKPLPKPVNLKAPADMPPPPATVPAPPAPPAPTTPADVANAPSYNVEFTHKTMKYGNDGSIDTRSATATLHIHSGRPASFSLGRYPQQCTFEIDLKPLPDPMVFIDLKLQCVDTLAASENLRGEDKPSSLHVSQNPKLMTYLGKPAMVRFGPKDRQPAHEITMLVTPAAQ